MKRAPNGRYTKEFRGEVLKMATESGMSVLKVSRRLSLPGATLERRRRVSSVRGAGETGKRL